MPWPDRHDARLAGPVSLSEVIERQLAAILRSDGFAAAASLRRLLQFVVEETLAGRGEELKEYSLGVAVLGKDQSFDPKADPIVRVQMRRLREHLARYYAADGRHAPLIIDIPKGTYMPAFRAGEPAGVAGTTADDEMVSVGRDEESAALQAAFDASAQGDGRMLCLAGEPGIGKTTLVDLFLRRLTARAPRAIIGRARCSERLVGTDAYLPILEALESLIGVGGETVRRVVAGVAPAWHVQTLPRVQPAAASESPGSGLVSSERLKRELLALLQAVAREQPLVLFFDDLHWADVSTVDALAYVVPRCTKERLLIVGTFRPAELRRVNQPFYHVKLELQGHGVCREVAMTRLTRDDVDRYLALQCAGHQFPEQLAARIHARTEGNPLFMAELVRLLRSRGVLARHDGVWVLVGELGEVERDLPESVRSMIEKKVGELGDDDRTLAAAAAVLGRQFESSVLAAGVGREVTDVEERLEALDRDVGFVRLIGERVLPDSTLTLEYAFAHVLYQNALYEALTPTRRAALSRALADALDRAHSGQQAEIASRLALLFEAGRDFARASDCFLLASRNAARLYAAEQAIALARQAIINAEHLDGAERHARVMAAAVQSALQHRSITRFDRELTDFELAERAAQALGDPVAQVHAIFGQATAGFEAKLIPLVRQCGTRAMEIARASGSVGAVAASTTMLALADVCAGDVAVGERRLDEAIPVLQQCGFIPHAQVAVLLRGLTHSWHLEHEQGESALAWARDRAGEADDRFMLLLAVWHQARIRGNQGRLAEASATL